MSMPRGNSPLDLDALTDEVIRLHRLANTSQSVAAAVQDFTRRVGPDRMAMAFQWLAAEKIRARVAEQGRERLRTPFVPPKPAVRADAIPLRVPVAVPEPAEPEVPDVPEPESQEEFRPGAVLWHTTQSDTYDGGQAEAAPDVPERLPEPVPPVLAGLVGVRETPVAAPAPLRVPRLADRQPGWRVAAMRSVSPEETWGALAEMVDVGGVSKQRKDLTREDLVVRFAFAQSAEKDASKELVEAQKHLGEAHREAVLAGRELDALRRHDAEKISDLPDYELDRLYGQRAA